MLLDINTTYNNDFAQSPISTPRLITCNSQAELLQTFAELINIDRFYIQYFPKKGEKFTALQKRNLPTKQQDVISLEDIERKLPQITRNNLKQNANVGVKRNQSFLDTKQVEWRSFVIEYDNMPLDEQIPTIERICLENGLFLPTCYVSTGNKSNHIYWTLSTPVDQSTGEDIQLRLINLFTGSDASFKSVVLASRYPGFTHRSTGKLSELYVWSGEKYDYEQLDNILPKLPEAPIKQRKSRGSAQGFKLPKQTRVATYDTQETKRNLIREFYDLTSDYNFYRRRSEEIQKEFKQHLKNISTAEQGTVHATLLSESRKIFGLVFAGLNINKAFDELYKITKDRVSKQENGDIDAAYRTINSALRYAIDNICDNGYLTKKPVAKFDADVEVNEQYLSSNILRYLEDTRILAIKSAIGTGKTTLFKSFIETNTVVDIEQIIEIVETRIKNNPLERIIIPLHRKSLVKNLDDALGKYGFITYDDYSITQYGALSWHNRLIITYDSLPKLTNEYGQHFLYDLMIADEADQAFDHLVQGKTEIAKHRRYAIEIFASLVNTSKNVILTSATLSNDEIDFISHFTKNGRDDIKAILNTHKPIIHDFIRYLDKDIILKKLNAFIRKSKKIAIACNSKAEAEGLHELLSSKHKNIKIALITPDTIDENIGILNALTKNKELPLDIDVLIYTPVLGTGFDINRIYFDYVFGIFNLIDALTADDLRQMCGRVRAPISNEVHVFVHEGGICGELDVKKIRAGFDEICSLPTKVDENIKQIVSVNKTVNDAYLDYLSKCIARKNLSLLDLSSNFWHLVKLDGHNITLEERRDKTKRNSRKIKEIKKDIKQKNIQNIADAKDINKMEFAQLKKKVKNTKDEKSSIDKYHFKYSTGFEETDKNDLTWYEQKGGDKACRNIELMLMPMDIAEMKDFDEKYLAGKETHVDFSNYAQRKIILQELLDLIDASKDEDGYISEESLVTSGFTQYIEEASHEIHLFLKVKPYLAKPMRTVGSILKLIGLKQKGIQITCADERRVWIYKVTEESERRRTEIINNIREVRLKQWRNDLHSYLSNPKYATSDESSDVAKFLNQIKNYLMAETLTV